MRLARIVFMATIILVLSPLAYTLPDVATYWEYYDSSGNVIGHIYFGCYGSSSSGTTSSPYLSINFMEQCVPDITWECPTDYYEQRDNPWSCISADACAFQLYDCVGYPH
jgi:hypothetical protein